MNNIEIKVKKLDNNAIMTSYATEYSAGSDLRACTNEDIVILPKSVVKIKTGLAIQIPEGFVGLVFARSGLASKYNIAPVNKVGVIDSDYRGEICVFLYNSGDNEFVVKHGDRIAQLVIMPYFKAKYNLVEELDTTERGENGFGSTGIK